MSKIIDIERLRGDRCRDTIDLLVGDLAFAENVFGDLDIHLRKRHLPGRGRAAEDACIVAALGTTRALRSILEQYRFVLETSNFDDLPF